MQTKDNGAARQKRKSLWKGFRDAVSLIFARNTGFPSLSITNDVTFFFPALNSLLKPEQRAEIGAEKYAITQGYRRFDNRLKIYLAPVRM